MLKQGCGGSTCGSIGAEVGVAANSLAASSARTSTSVQMGPLQCDGMGVLDLACLPSFARTSMSTAATAAAAAVSSIDVTDWPLYANFAITPMLPGGEEGPL